ncbi:MAG TPA: META domain-containing protein [Gemmatimonadaceae bacterium]|jgi:putative lipoprotein
MAQTSHGPLSKGEWKLLEINGTAAVPGETDRRPTIRFNVDSARADGSGGCNSYGGEAAVKGASLHVSRVISTKRACVDAGLNQQESRFFDALGTVDRYAVSADTLTLYHGPDVALRFVR